MIKKTSLLSLIICLFLVLSNLSLVQARSGLTVLSNLAEVDFPAQLSFNLSAENDTNITDIRLHYTVDRIRYARVISEVFIEFLADTAVEVKWSWDMRKTGGLPPSSSVEYWWTIKDGEGDILETEPRQVSFDDNRYDWYSLTEGKVTLYWYEGDGSFSHELMVVAQQALIRLHETTGAELERPVRIYIYANTGDLQGSMIYPQEWTGGVAFTRYGIIAIGIAPDDLEWGARTIAHELTHLVIHQMTFSPYGELPPWLDEGLAMNSEGELGLMFVVYLNTAITEKSLISVRSLSSPFSAYVGESLLAYAESYSLVQFLREKYGQEKMFELLETFKQGSSYDAALVKVYGFDMDGLNNLWRDYVAVVGVH